MIKPFEIISHAFSPNRCPFCKACIPYHQHCCVQCKKSATDRLHIGEQEHNRWYEKVSAPYYYEEQFSDAVLDLKKNGWRQTADNLSYYLYTNLLESGITDFDLIAYVPMTRKRKRKRGFNQAQKLAAALSRYCKKPVLHTLVKTRETKEQHTLSEQERRINLLGAFQTVNRETFRGKRVLLVDDVITTGSTVDECAKVLLSAGANAVYVTTVCATHHPKSGEKAG